MKQYVLAFHRWSKYTNSRFVRILKGSGDLQMAWEKATIHDFLSWGIEADIAQTIITERGTIDPLREEERMKWIGSNVFLMQDSEYPVLLKELSDPPPILYVRGDVSVLQTTCLAVVGTRLMTPYGKQAMETILPSLIHAGVTIVSGLAIGIDAMAHKITLDHTGKTIVVLGSGVDKLYPMQNKKLGEDIIAHGGAIVSENPLGAEPTTYSFPIRNRIISGLSRGTLVVEAKESSGSLITSQLALDQGRDVFAIPGNMFSSNTAGTHKLIKSGQAKLITTGEDILEEWNMGMDAMEQENRTTVFTNEKEERIYLFLSKEPTLLDVLSEKSEMSSSELSGVLTMLEVRGLIQNQGGGMWVRR